LQWFYEALLWSLKLTFQIKSKQIPLGFCLINVYLPVEHKCILKNGYIYLQLLNKKPARWILQQLTLKQQTAIEVAFTPVLSNKPMKTTTTQKRSLYMFQQLFILLDNDCEA